MIEVELKFKIEDPQELIEKLVKLSAKTSKPRLYELSVMYDNDAGIMQEKDGRIRVRQTGDEVEFCYKKPLTREGIKKEIEYEVKVSELDDLVKIIKEMGFSETTSYERYRTELLLDEVKVTIDEYPFACFVEMEGEEPKITALSKRLGFKLGENLTASCDTLFTEWRLDRGKSPMPHMTFEGYDK